MPVNLLENLMNETAHQLQLKKQEEVAALLKQAVEAGMRNARRLDYIAKYHGSQVFGETLGDLEGEAYIKALDRLMADYPTID